jgi:hypothetical protein
MFARNIRAAIPKVGVTKPRVHGVQIRYWTGFRLKEELPVCNALERFSCANTEEVGG